MSSLRPGVRRCQRRGRTPAWTGSNPGRREGRPAGSRPDCLCWSRAPQGRCGDEVLEHHDVSSIASQGVNQLFVAAFIGRAEPFGIAEHHHRNALQPGFTKCRGHLPGRDQHRGVRWQNRHWMPLGDRVQGRHRRRKQTRKRDPEGDHHPRPSDDKAP